ncbi:MAG: fumarylacetoacetate hydrolase family protein [Candidatus Rokuibacteriota bacterium]
MQLVYGRALVDRLEPEDLKRRGGMTLEPGDVLAIGTTAGVGAATGAYLKPGDLVEAEIDGVGCLVNRVTAPGEAERP